MHLICWVCLVLIICFVWTIFYWFIIVVDVIIVVLLTDVLYAFNHLLRVAQQPKTLLHQVVNGPSSRYCFTVMYSSRFKFWFCYNAQPIFTERRAKGAEAPRMTASNQAAVGSPTLAADQGRTVADRDLPPVGLMAISTDRDRASKVRAIVRL